MGKRLITSGLALALCAMAWSGCKDDAAVYQPAVARLLERANVLKNESRLPEAICRLEAAADIAPENEVVLYNLGVLHSQNAGWSQAIVYLEQARGLNPDNSNTLYTLGYSYQAMGDQLSRQEEQIVMTAPAIEAYQKAIAAYRDFLRVAGSEDTGRNDAEGQIVVLETKLQAAGLPSTPQQ